MRLRHHFLRFAAIVIALAAVGAASSRAQTIAVERITGEDGRFSIEMPAGYTSTVAPRPDGGTMRTMAYLWKDTIGQFNAIELAVIDPPAGSTKRIDLWEAQRQIQARYPGTPFGQARDIQLGPVKGLAFAFTVNSRNNQGRHTIAFRIYAVDGRLYEMLAATRTEDQNDPVVTAFMNSLRIIR